ncbi:MAG: hypothetical protein KH152_10995, partial [Finegoldia magna]|nr:hypothetical protein [Finegoldia magna]
HLDEGEHKHSSCILHHLIYLMKATIKELMGNGTSYSVKSRFLVVYILIIFQISSQKKAFIK